MDRRQAVSLAFQESPKKKRKKQNGPAVKGYRPPSCSDQVRVYSSKSFCLFLKSKVIGRCWERGHIDLQKPTRAISMQFFVHEHLRPSNEYN